MPRTAPTLFWCHSSNPTYGDYDCRDDEHRPTERAHPHHQNHEYSAVEIKIQEQRAEMMVITIANVKRSPIDQYLNKAHSISLSHRRQNISSEIIVL